MINIKKFHDSYKLCLNFRVVLLIFISGKIVITGAKSKRDVDEAFGNIYPILKGFKRR